jgi:hypothetical protein
VLICFLRYRSHSVGNTLPIKGLYAGFFWLLLQESHICHCRRSSIQTQTNKMGQKNHFSESCSPGASRMAVFTAKKKCVLFGHVRMAEGWLRDRWKFRRQLRGEKHPFTALQRKGNFHIFMLWDFRMCGGGIFEIHILLYLVTIFMLLFVSTSCMLPALVQGCRSPMNRTPICIFLPVSQM